MTKQDGKSLRHRLYHGETSYDFVGRRKLWFACSGVFILIGVISLLTQGLNYSIEFKGGNAWEVEAPGVSVSEARDALRPVGLEAARIQIQGSDIVRVQFSRQTPEKITEVRQELADLARVPAEQVSINDVGPSWGESVTRKARTALIVFFVLIAAYISLRFEWKMAIAALAAVVHDILITVGVYSLSRFEVTPATVIAFLTILGYSLYDTIVVFDKVQENTRGLSASGRMTYSDTVNLSMNQVLMRSLNTSIVAILPILSVLLVGAVILGASTLKDFGLALLVGLLTGAYSSIFIAAPILAMLKEREPRYANIRQRLTAKGGGTAPLTPAAAAAMAGSGSGSGRGGAGGKGGAGGGGAGGGRSGRARGRGPEDNTAEDDVLVAAGDGMTPEPGDERPRRAIPPVNRPGPRPRKKGKRR